MLITAHGGRIEVARGRLDKGEKVFAGDLGIAVGTILGT
jgi:hypothetical protein